MKGDLHIPINRKRLLLLTILYCVFALIILIGSFGLAGVLRDSGKSSLLVQIPGIAIFIALIFAAGAMAKKRADKAAGIYFGKEGIVDRSSAIGVGLIKWKDIVALDKAESERWKLIVLKVKKPEDVVKSAKNAAVEKLLRQNIRKFNSPVVIDPKYLEPSFENVLGLFAIELEGHGK